MPSSLPVSLYPCYRVYADGANLQNIKITFFNFFTRSAVEYKFIFSPKSENGSKTSLTSVVNVATGQEYSVSYDSSLDRYNINGLLGLSSVSVVGSYFSLYFDVSLFCILDVLRSTASASDSRIHKISLAPDTTWLMAFSGLLKEPIDDVLFNIQDMTLDIRGILSSVISSCYYPSKGGY